MRYLVIITEHTPTEDGTDICTRHLHLDSLLDLAKFIENFAINFGCLANMIVVPEVTQ